MIKGKIDGNSSNPQAKLLAKLMQEMPEIFSEGKIDSKKLKATLGEDVITDQERYGLTWAGKAECFKKIQETTTNTLKPCRAESVDFDKTENLFIEGDNLQVLKVLQKSYYSKVKMIYIDPPYNTGNDFIYNDKFSRTKKEELIANESIDEEGNVINHDLYRQNTRDSGHFHSNWLNMMYPRLFLARNLLKQDGVIFVSIDDNEVKNLRAMMDEIFGEENFIGQFVWRKKAGGGQADDYFVTEHEYIVVYCRSDVFQWKDELVPVDEAKFNKEDEKGRYTAVKLAKWGNTSRKEDRPSMYYPVKMPDDKNVYPIAPDGGEGRWRVGKKRMQELLENDLVFWGESKGTIIPYEKIYRNGSEIQALKDRSVLYELASTGDGTNVLTEIFGKKDLFENPKPIQLVHFFARNNTGDNDLILDFFAGSGTAAHAVMQLNAEDGGNRKWICVQLPEKCKEGTEALKTGFVTIADIAKERIRRAGKKIKEGAKDKKLDLGFKAFKLDESNFKIWNTQIANVEQLEQQLMDFIDNVRPESSAEDMLYELILKSGKELNIAIEEKQADGCKYHRIGDGSLIICLADKLTRPLFETILKDKPEKIITLDRSFANNDQLKINIMLDAERAGVKEFKVI
ncbi:MAG: site-specific DNA-methyltransferase [Candidatus Gracilibacteria bacterium]|jgi:adenine-specific DNA-methyltransferase